MKKMIVHDLGAWRVLGVLFLFLSPHAVHQKRVRHGVGCFQLPEEGKKMENILISEKCLVKKYFIDNYLNLHFRQALLDKEKATFLLLGHLVGIERTQTRLQHISEKKLDSLEGLLSDLLRIEGVIGLSCKTYEISLERAEFFDWEEMIPSIRKVIEKYF